MVFQGLAELETPVDREELEVIENIYTECNHAAHMAFVDNHNAGYYINSYTTKLNPTMDNVLKKLLDSVRRLQSEWQESAAAKEASKSEDDKKMYDKINSADLCRSFLDSSPASVVQHGKAAAKWRSPFSSATYLLPPTVVGQCICERLSSWLQKLGDCIMGS